MPTSGFPWEMAVFDLSTADCSVPTTPAMASLKSTLPSLLVSSERVVEAAGAEVMTGADFGEAVAAVAGAAVSGTAAGFAGFATGTGAPQLVQNFVPVSSWPQEVQYAMTCPFAEFARIISQSLYEFLPPAKPALRNPAKVLE